MRSKRLFGIALCAFLLFLCAFLPFRVLAVGEGEFVLRLSVNPEETGSFQVKISGEEVMDSQELSVKQGAAVSVKANPAEGYVFDHWVLQPVPKELTAEQLRLAELSFAMPGENVSAEAYFTADKSEYTVTVEANDYGMGNFGHKDFAPGQTVSVDALAYDGYRFVRWQDLTGKLKEADLPEGWETQSSIRFTMPAGDVVLSPEFEPITYYLTLKIVGEGEAIVVGKEPNEAGKYACTMGEALTLAATPARDHVFVNWGATNSAQLVDYDLADAAVVCPASDFTLTATFASSVRNLTVKGTEGGTVSPEPGVMSVGVGNIVALSATPNEGFAFSHWECSTEEGSFEAYKDSETNFTMPENDCTVTAVFMKGGYRLTLSAGAGGDVEGKEGVYEMGEKVPIEATALEGYVFSYWKCSVSGSVEEPRKLQTQVVIPGEDVKVTAVFVLKASLAPEETFPAEEEEETFPWVILIPVFLFSAVAITLVILREQLNLSYRYLIGKWYEKLKQKFKKK